MRNSSEKFSQVTNKTLTLAVGALLRALASRRLALSYSLFSDSSFTAASQISSLLGLAWTGGRTAFWHISPIDQTVHPKPHVGHPKTELFFTWKARARMLLAAGTSSASHLDLAPISQRTSALGQ